MKKRRFLSILLTIAIMLSMLPAWTLTASAASGTVTFTGADRTNIGQTLQDEINSNNILGINLYFFNASSPADAAARTKTGSFAFFSQDTIGHSTGGFSAIDTTSGWQNSLDLEHPQILVMHSSDGSEFSFKSVYINGDGSNQKQTQIEGFLDGASTGFVTCTLDTDNNEYDKTFDVSSEDALKNVDEIRITNLSTWKYGEYQTLPHGNWAYFNEFTIGEPIVTASNDAGLTSILGQTITASSEAGTSAAPKTASISVANSAASISVSDIVKHNSAATVNLYSDSAFSSEVTSGNSISLAAGGATMVYIKVTAQDGTTILHYAVTLNRATAASPSISLVASPDFVFEAATAGYSTQPPYSVRIQNTGTSATGTLNIALSGTNADAFILSKTTITDITAGNEQSFNVIYKTGLSAGTYTATVTVSGSSVTSKSFNVSFTVKPAGTTYTAQIRTYIDSVPANMAGSIELYKDSSVISVQNTGAGIYEAAVPTGSYFIYINSVATGRTLTVNDTTSSVTLEYFTVSFSATKAGTATGSSVGASVDGVAISSGDRVMSGKTVAITASGTGAGSYTYAWSGTGTSSQTTATLSIPISYTVNAVCVVTGIGTPPTTPDYEINDNGYSWTGSDQTVVLSGANDILTIHKAPTAAVRIEIQSADSSAVTIDGNSVACANMSIIVSNDISLVLNDVNITAPLNWSALELKSDGSAGTMTISITGVCSLNGTGYGCGIRSDHDQDFVITGDGILNATGGGDVSGTDGGSGIFSTAASRGTSLTIDGAVTIIATGGSSLTHSGGSGIDVTSGSILIKSGVVNATSGVSYSTSYNSSFGIRASFTSTDHSIGGNIIIKGGTVKAIGGDAEKVSGGYGIYAFNKLRIEGGSVTAVGGNSLSSTGGAGALAYEQNLEVSGGNLTATGGNSESNYGGQAIYSFYKDILVTGGTVTAKGGQSVNKDGGRAIVAANLGLGNVLITGGNVTATGGNGGINGAHAVYADKGTIMVSSGASLIAVGGTGTTGMGGVGLRATGNTGTVLNGNTVSITNSAGNVYIRGGQGASGQRASVMGKDVYIATGNIGPVVMEGTNPRSIKNKQDGDNLYMVKVTADPADAVTIQSNVSGSLGGSYTYSSTTKEDGVAYMWLPADPQTISSTGYYSKTTTVTADDSNVVTISKTPPLLPPTATGGVEYIDITNVTPGAALKLYTGDGTFVSSTYKDLGNGTYRFENVLPNKLWFYVTQTADNFESENSAFVGVTFRIPSATPGIEYVDVSGVAAGAELRLYSVSSGKISSTPVAKGDGTFRFENVEPDSSGFYVTQYANEVESENTPFFGVALRIPAITGENKQITVSNIYPGATLILYNSSGNSVATESNVTDGTYVFSNVAPGSGYYVIQSINDVQSQVSNAVTVYAAAPAFVGGTSSMTVLKYSKATDLSDQLYVSDIDVGQTLTWSIVSGPSHGTLSGFPVTGSTNGAGGIYGTVGSLDTRVPGPVTYTPDSDNMGSDSFTVQVSDGVSTDTRTITVNVIPDSRSTITASDSSELMAAINNPAVSTINLNSGTVYKIAGAEINRTLTINGNGATIEVLYGVGQGFDNQTIYHLGLPDANGNRRYRGNIFWYVKDGGDLTVNNLTLRNKATTQNAQGLTGIFAAILASNSGNLNLSNVAFKDFWFTNTKFMQHNNIAENQGLYATYSDMSYGVYSDYNSTGTLTISDCIFDSTNAFRDAVHLYNGSSMTVKNSTFNGTDHPERLRSSDGFEYGMYLYGGNCTIENNTITGYDSKLISGYTSSGIALIPYNNGSIQISGNTIEGNDVGLDLTGGWKSFTPGKLLTINGTQMDSSDNGFKVGEAIKASNIITGNTQTDIFMKLDQDDNDAAFVYYSQLLSITDTNTLTPTLEFSVGAKKFINSAKSISVEQSEDNGLSWTAASIQGTLDTNSTSAVVTLQPGKAYKLRLTMTHHSGQTPNTLVTGYSESISFTTPAQYTLTYTAGNNGTISGSTSQTVLNGKDGTEVEAIPDTGYHFVNWSDGVLTAKRTYKSVTDNLSVTANFAINSYKVSFSVDGGSAVSEQTIGYNNKATKPADPTKTGYTFAGWFTSNTFATEFDFANTAITADTTVYAKWSINTYKVSFSVDGGSAVSEKTINYNNKATKPADPTKTGYTFAGWFTSNTFATEFDFANTAITVDTTVYAKWNIIISSNTNNNTQQQDGVIVLVNGKSENIGAGTTSKDGDKTVTTVTIDQKKLEEKLEAEGNNAVVTIPVNDKSDVVVGELNGQMVKNMESKQAVLEVKTGTAAYTLPAQQINIDAVSQKLGASVELKDIKVQVQISTPTSDTVKVVENSAKKGEFSIVVPPVDFNVQCSFDNKIVEISHFNAYVERTIAIPDGVDPSKITTGIVVDPDGTVRHVPTKITIIGGKYYAKINSVTNSTYSVVWHPLEFKDVEKHWAEDAVNEMGSRMVVGGVGNDMYAPDRDITRAEFAAIMVKALGLKPGTGNNPFSDVKEGEWYVQYIETAYQYGIISGYGNGKFGPQDTISREQAMTMIAKAMNITGLKVDVDSAELEDLLQGFVDSDKAVNWAKESITKCIKSGIVSGRSGNTIAPKANITRAEVAVIVKKLLQKSKLI